MRTHSGTGHRHKKSEAFKVLMSKIMQGKRNALGNHTKRGPMSLAHRAKISIAIKRINKVKRAEVEVS